jgi:hypothetical protein
VVPALEAVGRRGARDARASTSASHIVLLTWRLWRGAAESRAGFSPTVASSGVTGHFVVRGGRSLHGQSLLMPGGRTASLVQFRCCAVVHSCGVIAVTPLVGAFSVADEQQTPSLR